MKAIWAAAIFAATPALAGAVASADAAKYVGHAVVVEGIVTQVRVAPDGVAFLEIGGRYPDNPFAAVIKPRNATFFGNIHDYAGEMVDVSGTVRMDHGKPQIELFGIGQIQVLRSALNRRIG